MFSTATITSGPVAEDDPGGGVFLWWESSSPSGTTFQVYVDRALLWYGTARQVTLPPTLGSAVYQVGTVGSGEESTDFSASLPVLQGGGDRALLEWDGGAWEDTGSGMAGFHVYGESSPGAGVSYVLPLETIPLAPPGLETDGYGMGGFGMGGWGSGTGHYTWRSERLTNGTWTFGVRPFDNAGNEGATETFAVAIARPPEPPARDATSGLRLSLSYNPATFQATLNWLASPG